MILANLEIKLSASKRQMYSRQRVVGRVGDGGLTTIGVQLLEADESTPFLVNQSGSLKFVGINSNGDYTEGIPDLIDGSNGIISYTFSKENFAVSNKFQRAYFEYTDPSGSKVTFQDFVVDVLQRADISAEQAEYYISSLESLLANMQVDFDKFIADSTVTYDVFYQKYNELIVLINSAELKANSVISKVDSALVEFEAGDFFNKQESSANVIYQLVGKEKVRMTFTADFSNKESGSDDKNPHWASAVYGLNELPSPSDFKTELVQLRYDSLKILDGQKTIVNTVAGTANQYPCLEHKWDIVEIIKRELSEDFFVDRGAIDKASQATVAKKIIVSPLESSAWGFGTCPSGNSLKIANHINGVGWQTDQLPPNTTNLVKQITARNTATPSIDDEGFLRTIIYTEASSKTVQSQINVDYGNLVFSIEISMNEHIKSMMAANHRENLATQDEAEEGLNESKTMTPVRVFQAIAKWIANKFVSVAGNETILGIKNFTGGLLVSDKRVLTVDDILQTSGTIPLINGNTGVLKYTKQLKNVTLTFNGLNGKYGGTPSGSTLANLPADLRPANYFEELVGSTDRGAVNTAALSFATTGEINWQRNSSTASDYSFEVTYQTI